mmetsp:Transcript_3123/g.9092  ORF Transcript_3123/g.9092 Transcript_3123/m.9092 type:complete len:204 (-) Transcript_3123:1004-1615(-)
MPLAKRCGKNVACSILHSTRPTILDCSRSQCCSKVARRSSAQGNKWRWHWKEPFSKLGSLIRSSCPSHHNSSIAFRRFVRKPSSTSTPTSRESVSGSMASSKRRLPKMHGASSPKLCCFSTLAVPKNNFRSTWVPSWPQSNNSSSPSCSRAWDGRSSNSKPSSPMTPNVGENHDPLAFSGDTGDTPSHVLLRASVPLGGLGND